MPIASVIIPSFNRSHLLPRAVDSVLGQKTGFSFELLVIDDGSSDATLESLAPFRNRLRLSSHQRNRGVSAARNTGIRLSRGRFIAFLDSDDYWLPEKLETQLTFMLKNPSTRICQTEEIWIRNGRRVNPQKKHLKPDGELFFSSLERCLVSPSAVMMRRSLLEKTGGFDESLPACEDYDLWLRVSCRHPVPLLPQKLVVRRGGHPDQLSMRYRGMDRFRIQALVKILRSGVLNSEQVAATLEALGKKCLIYGNGCLKRGRRMEGAFYHNLPRALVQNLMLLGAGEHVRQLSKVPLLSLG